MIKLLKLEQAVWLRGYWFEDSVGQPYRVYDITSKPGFHSDIFIKGIANRFDTDGVRFCLPSNTYWWVMNQDFLTHVLHTNGQPDKLSDHIPCIKCGHLCFQSCKANNDR